MKLDIDRPLKRTYLKFRKFRGYLKEKVANLSVPDYTIFTVFAVTTEFTEKISRKGKRFKPQAEG